MKKIKGIFLGKTSKNLNTSASGSIGGASASQFANGYDLKEKDLPKIHKAAWTGDISKIKQLAKKDPTALDKENRTPLHLACAQGHADVVRELLEWNARTNIGDSQGKTPLMKAIECGMEECVRLLLSHKVEVNQSDRDKNTALHLAVKEGNTGMVAMLVSSGANVNVKNKDGQTPLILSVQDPTKRDDHTRILLENNADPNAVDKDQRSALHHACIEDGINHVRLLLQHNASTALKDVKGWTAEDCAMMKAHHACSQVVFDHNLKQRRLLTGSVPSTPRNPDSATVSRHTTPRDHSSASDFGMPQMPQEDADDSDDQTVSKHSLHDNRQDSWADDTDISSAADDHKLKAGAVKTSLTKHLKIDSDEEEEGAAEDKGGGTNVQATNGKPVPDPNHRRSPVKFRKVLVSTGDVKRPIYSRTPTPDADLRKSPASPYTTSTPSKIPVKQRLSGASHTSIEDDFTDEEDDSSPIQRNRVSFSDHQQVRNISATDDDTDIEDDEEEVEPTKKRRIETPEEASIGSGGYTPTGVVSTDANKLSKETFKALMADLGMEDISDLSDQEDDEVRSPRDSSGPNSQPNTPRGILKKTDGTGKPPAVQNPVDSDPYWDSEDDDPQDQDREIIVEAEVHPAIIPASAQTSVDKDEESDWDSTRHSETDKGNQSIQIREEVESPEIDSDLEDTLNPEKSAVEKDPTVNEDLSAIQDSNTMTVEIVQESTTVEIVQESTTPDNVSGQDKLANTGEINALFINELNESTDISHPGSRSSSVAMDTQRALTVIERTELTDNDLKSSLSQDLLSKKPEIQRNTPAENEEEIYDNDEEFDSEDETLDRIEIGQQGTLDTEMGVQEVEEMIEDRDDYENQERETVNEENEEVEHQEIEELISEEMDYYNSIEKSEGDEKSLKEASLKEEIERSVSEGIDGSHAEFKVMDRLSAPKVMLEYEPSTTEAEDSDTLDTESLQEDFVQMVKSKKKKQSSSVKDRAGKKLSSSRNGSISSDKEVARALADESPTTFASRHMLPSQDDFHRASTEPITQDTMEEQMSLAEDDGDETSQWDSSEEGTTPRTPRNAAGFGNQDGSPDVQEYEYYEEEEESEKQDKIQEAVTSFGVRQEIGPSPGMQSLSSGIQSQPTPEPQSDSSQLRSRDTPDPPTTSGSASMQRTVITAHVEEPDVLSQQQDEEDDNWDSEDDIQSGEEEEEGAENGEESPVVVDVSSPVVIGIDSVDNTPRTPRGQSSVATDDESVSEWEIERQKEKEEKEKREKEMRLLQEMEEEEERQRQWEEEERRRQAEIEREAQAELERERLAAEEEDESDVSDFSDNILPDSARQHDSEYSHPSQHASQRSQPSEERSQRSDNSNPNSLTSPRVQRELKKPPPKLVVTKFIPPSLSQRENKTPVTLGEIENESPAPVYDDMIQPEQEHHRFAAPSQGQVNNVYGKEEEGSDDDIEDINDEQIENAAQYDTKGQFDTDKQNNYSSFVGEYNSSSGQYNRGPVSAQGKVDVDNQSDEDEFEDGVHEDMILPQDMKKVESANTQDNHTELPVNSDIRTENARALLSEPPPLPKTSPPVKAMSLQSDGQSVEDDDLDIPVQTKPPGPSFLPDLSGTTGLYSSGLEVPFDDDGLSVTSTENGDISSSYRPENLPYGKDMLVNMNLSDSSAVLKLQEHLREHRKQLEYERNQKMLLESKQKQMSKDKTEMQKMIDSLKYQKSALEQSKLDLEAKIRNLEYCVSDEEEKKKNAELLLKKTKEQLAKKEEQYTNEMEAKQRAELAMRNVQMELRSSQNQMKDLEEEKAELERQVANEKNARQLQEKINEEQQRLQQHIQEESLKTSSQKDDDSDEANRSLELADDDIKHARDLVEKYKNEITALKAELQRQRTRLTDENSLLSSENEKLQQRVEDLRNEVKDHEEALTQLTVQQNLHNSKLMSESTMLSNSLDKERVAREKIEAELESFRTRLQASTVQLEKSQQARNDSERRLHGDREEWARQLDRKDQELTSLKEKVQAHIQALNATETKLNAVENELQISNTTLLERTNQYQQAQRDLQFYKTAQENNDSNYRHEKELNAKHVAKIESLQERLSSIQHENLSLKQQVESAQHLANDRAGFDLQDKLNTMISSLKSDHEKARASLEEKNTSLQDTITRLRDEVRNSENRRSNLEQDIRRLNQEQNDIIRKLSIAEASLDVASKARDQLEQERLALKMEIEKLQQKYNTAQESTIQAQTRMGELVDRLDRTEQSRLLSNQQLADTSATMQAFNTSKTELEENYQKIQVENVRLDAELKHEKQKTDMLQRDLADSQKVRSSLEALCSNLKSTNAHLEEKLGGEVVSRNMLAKEAEDHKGLWEQEVLSRSKLGLRIAQLERHKQETSTHLEEEKRRTRKALEQKKVAETKLEAEQDKCLNLQKEVANLKAYLKVAKKRLKDPGSDDVQDSNENRMSNLHSAFDKERQAMEEMLVSVKSQLEHMKIQLQDEMEEKERVHHKNQQLEKELKTVRKLERSVHKIDRSKRKLEEEFKAYKNSVETGYTEKSTVEEAKKDIEARYRQELNRKLDEVNNYLEEQARTRQRLDLSREEQESKLRSDKKKFEEECIDLRIKYEQAYAKLETKDLEAKRYRDLYESEMQWRMRLSEQLYKSTDKAFGFKNKLVAERQKNRMYGSLTNLSMNGQTLDLSKINGTLAEDALSNRLRAELDRSIAKHLEAAPHDQIRPLIRSDDPVLGSNFAKASADYIEVLKRKYCV
ncbi:trichohyalin-like isoform X6 [Mercenaria mercenaria]|uniref:trichohyalin-like isoform X6 n=1 Tax=Mercenaria mercenaria TaxID=6596 RepID=UPI00234ED9AB|nr:trichohyalin-like isoform X6 [Mercenaria mercenaria]